MYKAWPRAQPTTINATTKDMEIELDPTSKICRPRDSFKEARPDISTPPFYEGKRTTLYPDLLSEPGNKVRNLPPTYVNAEAYAELSLVKESYSTIVKAYGRKRYDEISRASNPFETIGRSRFMNRAAIKLANIDAIWKITPSNGGYFYMQSEDNFRFVDLAGAPGAWTEYIQWRLPRSVGMGISLRTKNKNFSWNEGKLDMSRFFVEWGDDGTGSVYTNGDSFSRRVHENIQEADAVVADGGLDVVGEEYKQEFLNTRLVASEAYIATQVLRPGGKFVVKIYDAFTRPMVELLYVISTTFERFAIFKPMSSRPANSERYVIAQGYTANDESINVLKKALSGWSGLSGSEGSPDNNNVVRILRDGNIPPEFEKYVTDRNNESVIAQIRAGSYILETATSANRTSKIPKYNNYYALAYWNVPGNF